MTRDEHMRWAKDRALAYLPGDPDQAFASLASDLQKHPETEGHPAVGLGLGLMLLLGGHLDTPEEMRKFIEGFR